MQPSWKQIQRKAVYQSKFLSVFEDTVELPNGLVFDDYTVIQKPDIVVIVPITSDDRLIMLDEYKYAAGAVMRVLPAGHIKHGEDPVEAARRELLEETGYGGGEFVSCGVVREYPTKDLHKVHVVMATGLSSQAEKDLDEGEENTVVFMDKNDVRHMVIDGRIQSASTLAALAVSGMLSSV